MDLNRLKNKVVVSVQAMPDEPLYKEDCINAMMQTVLMGGAQGLRVAGARDVRNAKTLASKINGDIPVIGLTKPDKLPENWIEVVYITPTLKQVDELIDAGADIIAFDGTSRPRECSLKSMIERIHSSGKLAMADIATYEEAINCHKLGVDIVSTTLSGYTKESQTDSKSDCNGPDFELLERLVKQGIPTILEGRVWEPHQVKTAFELGAYSVVIGSAITRPQLITRRFIELGA